MTARRARNIAELERLKNVDLRHQFQEEAPDV
jgi:hypothetical protein